MGFSELSEVSLECFMKFSEFGEITSELDFTRFTPAVFLIISASRF